MVGTSTVVAARDRFAAALTDAALAVTARYGVEGDSVGREVDLWKALRRAVRGWKPAVRGEQFLGTVTDAAYHVALERGFRGSFLDLQLDLWRAFGGVFGACRSAA
jgi:hypothetical protein